MNTTEMTAKLAELMTPILMEVQAEIEKGMAEVDAAAYERGRREATQWIPCSERLPGANDVVLISYFNGEGWFVDMAERFRGEWCVEETVINKERVNAWMPLPAPYRPEVSK